MGKKAAIVVSYNPEIEVLTALLTSLSVQVDMLILVDNGGAASLVDDLCALHDIKYVPMGNNAGLGAALNAGFQIAVSGGAEYVVTFDQDSHAAPSLIADLAVAMLNAMAVDANCIAVSPMFFDRRERNETNFPFYQTVGNKIVPVTRSETGSGLISADTLITSGMYVRAAVWTQGLKYDETMFVDFTDTEWCFRARGQGYSLYGCSHIRMGHALSDAPPIKIFGLAFFRYAPLRRYFYFRNTIAVVLKNHTPKIWKKRLILGLILRFTVNIIIDRNRIRSIYMMSKGILHGIRRSLGPWH